MSDVAALVRRYVERYNANDVDGMLDCCADDVVFETVTNPGGSLKLNGKDEMREVIEATTRAFRERRHEVVAILVDGERAAVKDDLALARGEATPCCRNQGAAGAGPASERDAGTTLPDPHADAIRTDDLRKFDIGAIRKERMILELRADHRQIDGVHIVDKEDGMA